MEKTILVLSFLLLITFYVLPFPVSHAASKGIIRGHVIIPKDIVFSMAPKEAKIFIHLNDYTPKAGRTVLPWEAPTLMVIEHDLKSLTRHRVDFEFSQISGGRYGVSVLIDMGRPHVPRGSHNFTAYPGDYAGGTTEDIELGQDQHVEISIDGGLYVTIPEGYDAPLYAPE